MNIQKRGIAAIWARVSTHDQGELSLDSQVVGVRRLLVELGYEVPDWAVLMVEWTSTDLMACPKFQSLRRWVDTGGINAVGTLDRDRFQAQGLQRLLFLSDCHQHNVEVITAQGVPMLEGSEGQLIELALALGKERSVWRAQQGARDGLRDRAVLKGLPTTNKAPYGFEWNGSQFCKDKKTSHITERIWHMGLNGLPLERIARSMSEAAIPSPTGKAHWNSSTIARILTNPIYKGEYYALRTLSVLPSKRLGHTYGKSTHRQRDPKEWIPLPGLVKETYVSQEEFAQVEDRLARNKAQGGTVKQPYLLRGVIRCEACGRPWRGKVGRHGGSTYYRYICSGTDRRRAGPRCDVSSIKGQDLEERIWKRVVEFLTAPEVFLSAAQQREEGSPASIDMAEAATKRLERRISDLDVADARAFSGYARGITAEKTYVSTAAELRAERAWLEEDLAAQRRLLAEAQHLAANAANIRQIYPLLMQRITTAGFEDMQFVLECLDAQVEIGPSGVVLSLAIPDEPSGVWDAVSTIPRVGGNNHLTAARRMS